MCGGGHANATTVVPTTRHAVSGTCYIKTLKLKLNNNQTYTHTVPYMHAHSSHTPQPHIFTLLVASNPALYLYIFL